MPKRINKPRKASAVKANSKFSIGSAFEGKSVRADQNIAGIYPGEAPARKAYGPPKKDFGSAAPVVPEVVSQGNTKDALLVLS